jgi:hypothetical protein
MRQEVNKFIAEHVKPGSGVKITIVSGGADGADKLAEELANEMNLEFLLYKPNWKEHGQAAGFIRNTVMVEKCTHAIGFWDGKSRGTKDTITKLTKIEKPFKVIRFFIIRCNFCDGGIYIGKTHKCTGSYPLYSASKMGKVTRIINMEIQEDD